MEGAEKYEVSGLAGQNGIDGCLPEERPANRRPVLRPPGQSTIMENPIACGLYRLFTVYKYLSKGAPASSVSSLAALLLGWPVNWEG